MEETAVWGDMTASTTVKKTGKKRSVIKKYRTRESKNVCLPE